MTKDTAASADPAADLALVKRLRKFHRDMVAMDGGECGQTEMARLSADVIERLLRERDAAKAEYEKERVFAYQTASKLMIMQRERDAALRERDDLTRRWQISAGGSPPPPAGSPP